MELPTQPIEVDPASQPVPSSLETEPLPQVDIGPSMDSRNAQPSTNTAEQRSRRILMGFPNYGKEYKYIYDNILRGDENLIRDELTAVETNNRARRAQKVMEHVAANVTNGPLTPEQVKLIRDEVNGVKRPPTPDSIIEEEFSRAWLGHLENVATKFPEGDYAVAKNDLPGSVYRTLFDRHSAGTAYREYALKVAQDVEDAAHNQSYVGAGVDLVKRLFPGYTDVQLRGIAAGVGPMDGVTLGQNLARQRSYYLSLPFEQYKVELRRDAMTMAGFNPGLAKEFMHAMIGLTSGERFMHSLSTALDASVIPAGKLTAAMATRIGSYRTVREAIISASKEIGAETPSRAAAAEASGDIAAAAVARVASTGVGRNPTRDAIETAVSGFKLNAQRVAENPGSASRELVTRIKDNMELTAKAFGQTLAEGSRVLRTNLDEPTLEAVKNRIMSAYPGTSNNVADIGAKTLYDNATNTHHVTWNFQKNSGELWMRYVDAQNFAQQNGISKELIQRKGAGFYIEMFRPYNETDDIVRDGLLKLPVNNKIEQGMNRWINAFTAFARSPNDVQSPLNNWNRDIATFAPAKFFEIAKANVSAVQDLAKSWEFGSKTRMEDWNRVLKASRTLPGHDGVPGKFFRTVGELEDFYRTGLKRPPDDKEVAAYFAYTNQMELDWALRNIAEYRHKARVGAESHSISLQIPGGKITSQPFDGILKHSPPGGTDPVLVAGTKAGEERVYNNGWASIPKSLRERLTEEIKTGKQKSIEFYEPNANPLSGFGEKIGDRYIRYVVSPNVETKPLSYMQLARREGGHFEYDYDQAIKQAKVLPLNKGTKTVAGKKVNVMEHRYQGDETALFIPEKAMGVDLEKKMNEARVLLKNGDAAGAKTALYARGGAPFEWEDFISWFKKKTVDGKTVAARFSYNEPFVLVPKGKTIHSLDQRLAERYPKTFVDSTREGSLARQYEIEYTQPREAHGIGGATNLGTHSAPQYVWEPARLVDPMVIMNRSMSRMINNTFMDDYKLTAIEHWIQTAKEHLDASLSEIKYQPFHYFNHPTWKQGTPVDVISRLTAQRWQINQFLNTPTFVDKLLASFSQQLSDQAYKSGSTVLMASASAAAKTRDPVAFLRYAVTHIKLGFGNISQFMIQSQTYSTMLGIAGPKYAVSGTYAAFLHQLSRVNKNPEIMAKLDEMATRMRIPGTSRWRAGELTESIKELEKTGFGHVGGEYALIDSAFNPQLVKTQWGRFLDAGMIFFRGAERNVRFGAWHIAFREFRDKFPTKEIGQLERAQILDRADLLNINMSRASSSLLHRGPLSLTTQFLTYQIRMAELFWGKRLAETQAERNLIRARIIGVNTILYGMPMAAGVTGIPLADVMRKSSVENGYIVGENWLRSMLEEGAPAWITAMVTGGLDSKKGNWYSYGPSLGIQGFTTTMEALRSDNPWWRLIGGAAFSSMANTWESMDGFTAAMGSMIRGDGKFDMKIEDGLDVLREISSVNKIYQTYAAWNMHKWMSRKDVHLTDTTLISALYMTLMGLHPTAVDDNHTKTVIVKDMKQMEKDGLKFFTQEMQRGMQAFKDGDPTNGEKFFKRAAWGLELYGYPNHKYGDAIAIAAKGFEAMINQTDYNAYIQHPPAGKELEYQELYRRQSEMRALQGQR